MIVSTDKSDFSGIRSGLVPWAPAFEVTEIHLNGQLINLQVFQDLGHDHYGYRKLPGTVFYAPGWAHGYDDDDVAHTPLQSHGIRYELFGVVW